MRLGASGMSRPARVQGAALLASTLRDPLIVTREVSRLGHWIDAQA
jgi:hypothetical protein